MNKDTWKTLEKKREMVSIKVGEFLTRAANWYPDKLAHSLVNGDRYTFKQFNNRVNALSHAFLDMGLRPQEKVGILCHSCPQYMEVIFAAAKTRLVCTSINWRLPADGVAFIMKDSDAKVLFYSKRFEATLSKLRPLVSGNVRFVSVEGSIEGMINYNDLIDKYPTSEPETMRHLQDDEVYQMLYTSGTTGRMKGVMITNKNSYTAIKNYLMGFHFDRCTHHLLPFPLFHVANWAPIAAVYGCYTHSVMANVPFDAGLFLEYVEKERVTEIGVAAPMMRMIFDHPDFAKRDLSSIRSVTIGGSAVPVKLIREIKEKTNWTFYQGLGMTECAGSVTNMTDRDFGLDESGRVTTRIDSVGFSFLNNHIKVFDETDKECPPNVIGEICITGDNVMKGYHNLPEKTAEALRNDWYHSGDMGYMDEAGYLYVVDRKHDMIVTGGGKCLPQRGGRGAEGH